MGLFKEFVGQTRKPEGFLGKVMLGGMNSGHAAMADWGGPTCRPSCLRRPSTWAAAADATIIDSGIVSFSVKAPTITSGDLPSRVQEEIASKAALIRSEGKTIVSINKSDGQG